MSPEATVRIEPPYYPIVYVRGYAMTHGEREDTFHDTYYGFAATSVEKRQAAPPEYFEADVFEGQFIRFMKLDQYYADASNRGIERFHGNPSRGIWICRFYDRDYFQDKIRSIEEHARDLRSLIVDQIPAQLRSAGVQVAEDLSDYKVILIAHSMGGLVCRTLIQKVLPGEGQHRAEDLVHRLVTLGTPHGGIDLGRLPDAIEDAVTSLLNPFDSGMFKERRMRSYLELGREENGTPVYDLHSVGDTFPVKRCLNIIGSDHSSYSAARYLTGGFSDGLVKQDRAYMVGGPKPRPSGAPYPVEKKAFWANVHRAHSGRRGIVNSYESFENIQRFLFGNIIAEVWLETHASRTPDEEGIESFFDLEFTFTIRNTTTHLHRRQQDPCENALRLRELPDRILLHTLFLNSALKTPDQVEVAYSHLALTLRVVEHRKKDGFLWDREYPGREIFSTALEVRVGDEDPDDPGEEVGYRTFGGAGQWQSAERLPDAPETGAPVEGSRKVFLIHLPETKGFHGSLVVRAGAWPDLAMVQE